MMTNPMATKMMITMTATDGSIMMTAKDDINDDHDEEDDDSNRQMGDRWAGCVGQLSVTAM